MKKIIKKIVLLFILMLSVIGCTEKKSKIDKVKIAYIPFPLNVPSIVGKNKKIYDEVFEKHGIKVLYSEMSTGSEEIKALAAGEVDFVLSVSTTTLASFSKDNDIKIVNVNSRAPKSFSIYTNFDKITSPIDIKGMVIGVPVGEIAYQLLVSYLDSGGMTVENVIIENMTMKNAEVALKNRKIDVAVVGGSLAYNLKKEGYKLITDGEGYIDGTTVSAVRKKFYKENPEIIKIFEEAEAKVLDYIKNNPEESMQIVSGELELNINEVKLLYNDYDFNPEIKEKDIADLEKSVDFLVRNKMMKEQINVRELFLKK